MQFIIKYSILFVFFLCLGQYLDITPEQTLTIFTKNKHSYIIKQK